MLLFQNDYLTIDAQVSEYMNSPEWWEYTRTLSLYFTIQCNGKIKRTQISVDVLQEWKEDKMYWSINWLYLKDYSIIYQIFQVFNDLGYSIPLKEEIHPLINEWLRLFNPYLELSQHIANE